MVPLSARTAFEDGPPLAHLVAGVAHEVNDPTAYVTANLAVLAEHMRSVERAMQDIQALFADDPERSTQLQAVLDQRDLTYALTDARAIVDENLQGVHRISGFVRELRTFTQINTRDVDTVDVNEIISTARSSLGREAPSRARVVLEFGAVPTIAGDRTRLTQAVVQLICNGLEALPPHDDDAMVLVRTTVSDESLLVSVLDSGAGMTEAVKARMFEPFFSSRMGRRGLGLYLAASVARQHGGDVRVYSRMGEGTRVDLVLPLETGLGVPANSDED